MAQAAASGKPEEIQAKMAEGRLEKFYKEVCLMEQPFVKNPDITITDLLGEQVAKLGENIKVSRFTRYVLGESGSAERGRPRTAGSKPNGFATATGRSDDRPVPYVRPCRRRPRTAGRDEEGVASGRVPLPACPAEAVR